MTIGKIGYGDVAGREVSARVGGVVATTAAMSALPLSALVDGQIWLNAATGCAYFYKSSAVAGEGGIACTAGGRFLPVGVNKRVAIITHAELTTATNGTAEVENIGPVLPTGANVLFTQVYLTTQFTGGAASAVTLSVGIAGAATALINAFDAFGGTAGAWYTAGANAATRPQGDYSAKQIIATFTPDAGHSAAGLTAGSATIETYYTVA